MKTSDEMLKSLFERRERYRAEKKKKRRAAIRASASVFSFFLVVLIGIGAWRSGLLRRAPVETDAPSDVGRQDGDAPSEPAGPTTGPADNANDPKDDTKAPDGDHKTGQAVPDDGPADPSTAPEGPGVSTADPTDPGTAPPTQHADPDDPGAAPDDPSDPGGEPTAPPDDPGDPGSEPGDPGGSPDAPGAVYSESYVDFETAREVFAHPIVPCSESGFTGYTVGVVSQNGDPNASGAFCLSVKYGFNSGTITLSDQDRLSGSIDCDGDRCEYCGRIFTVHLPDEYDDCIRIGYFPTQGSGIAYQAIFDGDHDIYEIMDLIISIEI